MESYQGGVYPDTGDFQRLSQTIASNIKKISQNVSSMSKMVNQLQTPQDSHELQNQLRQLQSYTQKLVKDTSSLLMDLMKLPVDQPAQKMSRERLSDEYMASINAFQSTQRLAAQKTKEDVRKVKAQSFKLADPSAASGNREHLVELGEADMRKQEQLTMQSEQDLLELEARERDVRQLEDNIREVNEIFKDMGQIIHEQGNMVDSIEYNVDNAATHVATGQQQLQQAAGYKNTIRKRKVYIAIIVSIVVMIIIIVLVKN